MPWKVIDDKPIFFVESNVKKTKAWRTKTNKEFYEKYGHWYWFTGYQKRKRKGWIEQYDKNRH